MYCPQCGTQNDDSALFCGNCGEKLSKPLAEQTPPSSTQADASSSAKCSINPVINTVKRLAFSPLCLIAAVAFSLMIFFYISNAEVIGVNVMGMVRGILDEAGALTSEVSAALSMLNGLARVFSFVIMLPDILIAVGIWITLYSAFDKNKDSMSVSGLGVIKIVICVMNVLTILSVIAYSILSLMGISKLNEIGATLPGLTIFIMLLLLGAMIFRIFCLMKMGELVDSFKYTISDKKPHVPTSFVAIISFISCGGYTILALMQGALSNWCGAVAFLCFGLFIMKYRATMKELQDIARTFLNDEDNGETTDNADDPNKHTKGIAIFAIIAAVAAIVIGLSCAYYTAPGVDKQLVGEWQYGDDYAQVFEFKRNGVFIGNPGTEYEERGTYTAGNGVISVVIDGEVVDHEYRVIDSDEIQIYRSYITSNWERKYRWETLYRVE